MNLFTGVCAAALLGTLADSGGPPPGGTDPAIFGQSTVWTTAVGPGNRIMLNKVTIPAGGVLESVWVVPHAAETANVKPLVYSDVGNAPSALLAQGAAHTATMTGNTPLELPLSTDVGPYVVDTVVWLGLAADDTFALKGYDNAGSPAYHATNITAQLSSYYTTPPSSHPGGSSSSTIYALWGSGTITAGVVPASYQKARSAGDRRAGMGYPAAKVVGITASSGLTGGSTLSAYIDGGYGDSSWFGVVSNGELTFDFGTAVIMTEAIMRQSSASNHGTWKWQGSNDNVSYTDIGSTFTLGGATAAVMTSLAANTTAYRYYKLLQTAGSTSGSPYIREFDFKLNI